MVHFGLVNLKIILINLNIIHRWQLAIWWSHLIKSLKSLYIWTHMKRFLFNFTLWSLKLILQISNSFSGLQLMQGWRGIITLKTSTLFFSNSLMDQIKIWSLWVIFQLSCQSSELQNFFNARNYSSREMNYVFLSSGEKMVNLGLHADVHEQTFCKPFSLQQLLLWHFCIICVQGPRDTCRQNLLDLISQGF